MTVMTLCPVDVVSLGKLFLESKDSSIVVLFNLLPELSTHVHRESVNVLGYMNESFQSTSGGRVYVSLCYQPLHLSDKVRVQAKRSWQQTAVASVPNRTV